MTKKELEIFEKELKKEGYQKYLTHSLSDKETYGWFKVVKEDNTDEYGEYGMKYMIEFRIWDWTKYNDPNTEPYTYDILILFGKNNRIDVEVTSPKFDISQTEDLAKELFPIFTKHISLFDKNG